MKKEVLLLKYNKPTNESMDNLSMVGLQTKFGDLQSYGARLDILNYHAVCKFLEGLLPFDVIVMGDIFWPTGQNICRWANVNRIACHFVQHGQWKYTLNKTNPQYLPTTTLVYGNKIKAMMSSWPYAQRCRIEAVGSPRYDNIVSNDGDYVYLSPPVIRELVPSGSDRSDQQAFLLLHKLYRLKIDQRINLVVHPHYREGSVERLVKLFPKATFVDPQKSALDLIRQSKYVLTHRDSTVVIDAIACRKPVVLLNFDRSFQEYFPSNYFGPFAKESNSPEHCLDLLSSDVSIESQDYESAAKEYIVLGNASQRIANIIEETNVS